MDSKTNKRKSDATAPKLILIAVLGMVLAGVLYLQFGRVKPKAAAKSTPTAKARTASRKAPALAKKETAAPTPTVRKPSGSLNRWQAPDLATVIVYDPFALPASFPQPAAKASTDLVAAKSGASVEEQAKQQKALADEQQKMQAQLEALRHQGVHVIIKGRDEYVAVIGDQEIRVGDEIKGFKVVSIDSNSVQVSWEPN